MIKSFFYRFLYSQADASQIDGYGLPHDKELAARNAERVRAVIEQMGDKWILARPLPRPIDKGHNIVR